MNTKTPHRTLLVMVAALATFLLACGSAGETATQTSEPVASSAAETTSAPPVTEAPPGDPSDPTTDEGAAYCEALDDFFVAQNRVITEGIQADEPTWAEIIGELDAATPIAASAAPDNHVPILTGFGDVVSRMATLTYAEFQSHPTINDEASEWFFGELFIISSHASEVCLLDTSFDVEIDIEPTPPIDAGWTATCEAIDEDDFRIIWTNETGAAVGVNGDVTFTSPDGIETQSSFDLQVVPVGERVAQRSFSFDGTAGSCEVTRLDAFPVSDSIFFEAAEPGDTCSVNVADDGSLSATVEAVALRDGDVRTEVAFYDADGVRVASAQFFALAAAEGDVVTMVEPSQNLTDDGAVRCEVVGRFDF